MPYRLRKFDDNYTTVEEEPGAACEVLTRLADVGVSLVAFTALPMGPTRTQLTLFPDDDASMEKVASDAGMPLDGPHPAILVQGDDELGALAGIHERLGRMNINVYASTGVTDGRGEFGYIICVRPDKIDQAPAALED